MVSCQAHADTCQLIRAISKTRKKFAPNHRDSRRLRELTIAEVLILGLAKDSPPNPSVLHFPIVILITYLGTHHHILATMADTKPPAEPVSSIDSTTASKPSLTCSLGRHRRCSKPIGSRPVRRPEAAPQARR